MRPIIELCTAGVDLHRAPRAAIDDFLANRAPPAGKPPREGRGRKSRIERASVDVGEGPLEVRIAQI